MTLDEMIERLIEIKGAIGNGNIHVTDSRCNELSEICFSPKELEIGDFVWVNFEGEL